MLLPFYPYSYNGREHAASSTTPELRVGAWGPEELKYTYALIDAWSKGKAGRKHGSCLCVSLCAFVVVPRDPDALT